VLNARLNDILKVASTQDLTPDIDTLVKAKRFQAWPKSLTYLM